MSNSPTVKELTEPAAKRKTFNEADRRKRRKNYKDIERAFDATLRAHGFTPTAIQTIRAYASCHYEIEGQDYDKPVGIGLLLIGNILSLRGKSDQAKINTASDRASHLFTEAQPTVGYQAITRYKAHDDNGAKGHTYVDHITPVAELVAQVWAEKRAAILRDGGDRKQARIAESLEELAADAVGLLPVCDAELVDENGDVYAYLSDAEARDYSAKNPKFTAQPKKEKPKRQWFREDLDRLKVRLKQSALDMLDEAMFERGVGLPDTHAYSLVLESTMDDAFRSWRKTAHARWAEKQGDGEREELIHVVENVNEGVSDDAETGAESEAVHSRLPLISEPATTNEDNDLIFDGVALPDLAERPAGADESTVTETSSAPNPDPEPVFYSAFEAANYYAKRGFPVLPVCQFNPVVGRCTWAKHPATCKTRKPLVWADDKDEGEGGYRAATLDREKIRKWFEGEYRDQGVAIRTDGKITIDADVKDNAGGLESYQVLVDTFSLPETLTQITHSGGRHFVFNMPEDLPERYLKSWVRVGKKVGLPGIDLKVDKWGLLFVEPTRGPKGFYRWIDPDAPIATLPRKCCDCLHEARYTQTPEQKAKAAKASARVYTSSDSKQFDHDQSKYFRDVSNGDRHDRVLTVGNAMWHAGASEAEMIDGMRYHAARFSDPLNDDAWIVRTAASIAREVIR